MPRENAASPEAIASAFNRNGRPSSEWTREDWTEHQAEVDRALSLAGDEKETEDAEGDETPPVRTPKRVRSIKASSKFHFLAKILSTYRNQTIDEYLDSAFLSIMLREYEDGPGKTLTGPSTKAFLKG